MKRSISKIIATIALSLCIILSPTSNVFASTNSVATESQTNNIVAPDGIGVPAETDIQVLSYHTSKLFVQYLSPSWQYANYYLVTQVGTATATGTVGITYEGITDTKIQVGGSLSVSNSTSIGVNIPADPTHQSKLGFYANYYVCSVKQTYTSIMGIQTVTYGTVKIPTGTTFNQVVYY